MKELDQICQAVLDALKREGIVAVKAFPDGGAKAYKTAVAAVSVGAAEGKVMGFCNYLGEVLDQETQTLRECYGKQLEGDIAVEIRAATAADCEDGCAKTSEVLLGGLPSGIRPGELRWEALAWERETGLFVRRGALRCQAVFVAQVHDDAGEFLDFILKGVMEH